MSSDRDRVDKLEQIRKRSEKEKKERAYATRLEAIEEQRTATAKKGSGTLLVLVLIIVMLIVGGFYIVADSPKKSDVDLMLNEATKLSVINRVKLNPAVKNMMIIQEKGKPKELKLVLYVSDTSTITDGMKIGNEVMGQLMATADTLGSAQYDYIIVMAQGAKQLTLGRMKDGARSISWI